MQTNTFPFAFDAEQFKAMFKMPEFDKMFEQAKMPGIDFDAMIAAQQKNVSAFVEANKVALAGYQSIFVRQTALVEESLAKAKDRLSELQSQPMTAEQMQKNADSLKAQFEQALADVRELADMAQKANTEAFDIVKARVEEVVAEMKAATDKPAA